MSGLPGNGQAAITAAAAASARRRALSLLIALAVAACASMSTKITELDESRRGVTLRPGQDVVVLPPLERDVEALAAALEGSYYTNETYLRALQRALVAELNSLGVDAIAGGEGPGNTLQVVVTGLERRVKYRASDKDEATLRANVALVVDGERREFEAERRQVATTTMDFGGLSLAVIDPMREVIGTWAEDVARAIVQ